jgi:hypothetical protein
MADREKDVGGATQSPIGSQPVNVEAQDVRGLTITIQGTKQLGIKFQRISLIEAYGALSLVMEKLKKELDN